MALAVRLVLVSVFSVIVAMVACEPEVVPGAPNGTTAETFSVPESDWEIADVRVWTRDDLAYWVVSYDARWLGEGPQERQKCVFRTKNQEGVVVRQSGEAIEEGDDVVAETIYADEVPGQPTSVSIECD